jgi:hypothetical protein
MHDGFRHAMQKFVVRAQNLRLQYIFCSDLVRIARAVGERLIRAKISARVLGDRDSVFMWSTSWVHARYADASKKRADSRSGRLFSVALS